MGMHQNENFSDKIYFLTYKAAKRYEEKHADEYKKDGLYIKCIGGETVFLY